MRRFFNATAGLCALTWLLAVTGDVPAHDGFQVLDNIQLVDTAPVSNHAILAVTGINRAPHPLLLGINVFDRAAQGYGDRVTLERKVLSGPFRLEIPRFGLRRNNGRAIAAADQHHATVFAHSMDASMLTASISQEVRSAPPPGTIALDFGSADAPAAAGFAVMTPDNPGLICNGACQALQRDPFLPALGDGISGILGVRLDVLPGDYMLRLWTRDRGDWEYLPYHREQRIKINGEIQHYRRRMPRQWVRDVYLAGRDRKADQAKSIWDGLQGRTTGAMTFTVAAPDGRVNIAFAGDRDSATHLAALALIPVARGGDFASFESPMRDAFDSQWPITNTIPVQQTEALSATLTAPARRPLTEGGAIHAMAEITVPTDTDDLSFELTGLPVWARGEIWISDWTLRRPEPGVHWLMATDRRLSRPIGPVAARAGVPKRVVVRLKASRTPRDPSRHIASLVVREGAARREVPIVFNSIPIALAPRQVYVGAYLEDWPVTEWFRHGPDTPAPIASCVARVLSDFGLTAIGMPASPRGIDPPHKTARAIESFKAAFPGGVMAYAHLKRSLEIVGKARTLSGLATIGNSLSRTTNAATYWSIADEPSDTMLARLSLWRDELKAAAPDSLLVGHLNRLDTLPHADVFDRVFINHGPGPLTRTAERLRARGIRYWLYNLPSPRLGAGLLSWATEAEGYFQWHAMMPTADPYDPTDGREDDVFLVYPDAGICGTMPTIDQTLLELETGIWDLAWLRALEVNTEPDIQSKLRALKARASSWPPSNDPAPLIVMLDQIIDRATRSKRYRR